MVVCQGEGGGGENLSRRRQQSRPQQQQQQQQQQELPDRTFHNFGAPTSDDRQTLCNHEKSIQGFSSLKIGKCAGGLTGFLFISGRGLLRGEKRAPYFLSKHVNSLKRE